MALGATRVEIVRLFLARSAWLAAMGLACGVALGMLTTRFLSTWLVGVGPLDRSTFGATAIAICMVSLTASYLAARRATRIDPLTALRGE